MIGKLELTSSQMHTLKVEQGKKVNLWSGRRKVRAVIHTKGLKGDMVRITDNLSRLTGLPGGVALNIRKEGGDLRIGPLVGIFAGKYNKQSGSFGFRRRNETDRSKRLRSFI